MAQHASPGRTAGPARAGAVLVGRERETAELAAALEQAFAGRGSVVLLAGEPGIGKTSVARALCDQAEARGALTAWGIGWSGGAAPAYWPWVQVVRALMRSADADRLVAALGEEATWLAEIVPDLRGRIPSPSEQGATAGADEGRFRAYDALAELLRHAAAEVPLLVVLDDLHWADEASLHTLAFVARALGDAGVLLLGTYRDTELPQEEQSLLGELLGWSRRIPLRGLEPGDVRQLVEGLSAGSASDTLVEHLHAVTGGNPLFVGELVSLLDAEGRLGGDGASLTDLPLPDGVRDAIAQRLAPLTPAATDALGVASVIGARFRVATLSRAAGVPPEELLELLDAACRHGLLHPAPDSADQYLFSHALVQATLYEGLAPSRRAGLHRAVGEAIEELSGDRIDARLTELAHHFLEAAPLIGSERAVSYARRAGERAMEQFAYDEAATLFAQALVLLEGAGGAERLALLQALGDAQTRAGDTAAARRTLLEAADVARRHDDGPALARAALSCVTWGLSFGVDEELVRLSEEAVERLGDDPAGGLLARVKGELAAALYWSPERERAQRLCDEAVALAREQHASAGDRDSAETLAYVLGRALLAHWGPDSLERQLDDSIELVELSHALDDGEIELLARNWRISVLLESGDVGAVDQEIARVEHMATVLRQPRAMVFLPLHHGLRALLEGRFDEVERGMAESAEIGRRVRGSVSELAATAQLVIVRLLQGRLPELEEQLGAISSVHPGMVALRSAFALLLVQADRPAEARRELERLTERGLDGLPRDNTHIVMLALLAETAAEVEDETRCEELYGWLEPYSGRWVVSPGAAAMWPVDRSLGRLAGVLGRTEPAFAHLAAARAQGERAGSRPARALCALDEARLVASADAAAGHADAGAAAGFDRERLAGLAEEAHRLGAELGMRGVEREAARLRESLADSASAATPAARPEARSTSGTLLREGDVWTLSLGERVVRLKDAKGLRHLALLLANPGVSFPALELVAAGEGHAATEAGAAAPAAVAAAELSVRSGGQAGAGALLDSQAKAAYRARLEDLRETIDEAEAMNDPERAALARAELDEIAHELAGAVGLGGRDRQTGSDAERARVNATRAIRTALRRVEEHDSRLGRLLDRSIRTGIFCVYEPDPEHPIAWTVEA